MCPTGKSGVNGKSVERGEKKRQQSRSAAKCRRLTESEIFTQLAETLPTADRPTVYQNDRIGALRLAVTLCRTRRVAERFLCKNGSDVNSKLTNGKMDTFIQEAISTNSIEACTEGFVMVVNKVGQMLYLTGGVADIIGFTQVDLTGRYLRDYVHADDWTGLREQLCNAGARNPQPDGISDAPSKTFFRIKTALTPRGGRARKLTMAVYEPLNAYIMEPSIPNSRSRFEGFDYDEGTNSTSEVDKEVRFIHCLPFDLSSTRRGATDPTGLLISRHDLDMRFRTCDENLAETMGYQTPKALVGRSFFDFVHPEDLDGLSRDIKQLYRTSHSRSSYYRLLDRAGRSFWTETEMLLLVQNIRGVPQKSVICSHHILNEHERPTPLQVIVEEPAEVETDMLSGCDESLVPECANIDDQLRQTHINYSQPGYCLDKVRPIDPDELSPFIPCDTHTLSPVDDPDMPDLLPGHVGMWLGGKPGFNGIVEAENNRPVQNDETNSARNSFPTEEPQLYFAAPKETNGPAQNDETDFASTADLQLDFADIFGLNLEDSEAFSIEEAEQLFSQFEQDTMENTVESNRTALCTPTMPVDTFGDVLRIGDATSAKLAPISTGFPSRWPPSKKARIGEKSDKDESQWRLRKDMKTLESFEMSMIADTEGNGQSGNFPHGHQMNEEYVMCELSGENNSHAFLV